MCERERERERERDEREREREREMRDRQRGRAFYVQTQKSVSPTGQWGERVANQPMGRACHQPANGMRLSFSL